MDSSMPTYWKRASEKQLLLIMKGLSICYAYIDLTNMFYSSIDRCDSPDVH
jgi:hypothetical protein